MNYQRPLLTLAAFALTACHANLYSTPRTVPKGKAVHIMAVHAEPYPAMVYIARVGVADRVDAGLHATLYSNKVDVKVNFLRTKYLDMAVNPGVSFGLEPIIDDYQWKGSLPLMIGLNVDPRVTMMVQGGPTLMRYQEPDKGQDGTVFANGTVIVTGAVGGAIQIRATDLFYIQPEFSINYFVYDPVYGTRYWPNIGIGFGFGPQPRYDDTDAKSKD